MIPVPFCGGQPRKGVEHGPEALMKAGLQNQLETLGWKFEQEQAIPWDQINSMDEKNDGANGANENLINHGSFN